MVRAGDPAHPYGGLLAGRLLAGETLLVNGATGAFGSAGVAVGVAMGAGRVVATGRNEKALADLERRFGERVRTVRMAGNEEEDRRQMQKAAGGPIDCVLDLLPPMASPSWVRAAVLAVRPYGRAVLMGGIRDDVEYLYMDHAGMHRGSRSMDVSARRELALVGLIRSGLIRLEGFAVAEFPWPRSTKRWPTRPPSPAPSG